MSDHDHQPGQSAGEGGTRSLEVEAMTAAQVDAELARQERHDPDGTLISDFLAGDLDEVRARAVRRRLDTDPDFARRAEPYLLMRELLREGEGEREGEGRSGEAGAAAEWRADATGGGEGGRRALRERFRIAAIATFLVGGAIGGWIGYRVAPVVAPGLAFAASGIENSDGEGAVRGRMVIDSAFAVELDPDSRLAYVDAGRRSTFPAPPGQHEIQLDGGGAFELMLPTARELRVRTPFVTVRGQRARFRIRLDPPCTTTVSVSEGEVVLKRRFVADTGNPMVFAGQSFRVGCDQSLVSGAAVPIDGVSPVRVDSTILPPATVPQ